MTLEDARYYAKTMTELQRRFIMLCSKSESYQYRRLAEMTGTSYSEAKAVGDHFKAMNIATIRPTMMAGEFSGSGIVLNERGDQVKIEVAKLVSHLKLKQRAG